MSRGTANSRPESEAARRAAAEAEKKEAEKKQTRYVVQRKIWVLMGATLMGATLAESEAKDDEKAVWEDLINPAIDPDPNLSPEDDETRRKIFSADNQRNAIKTAMEALKLEEGDFRAIPETSANVHQPRVKRQTVWG